MHLEKIYILKLVTKILFYIINFIFMLITFEKHIIYQIIFRVDSISLIYHSNKRNLVN